MDGLAVARPPTIALMLLPRIGVMDWKASQRGFPRGTVVLFAVGISVGTALLTTHAAGWPT